jgi:hypothetical protein
MKTIMIALLTLATVSSYAASIEVQNNVLKSEIAEYLNKNLVKCTLDIGNEVFYVKKVQKKEIRVDQGITDVEYTIDVTYDAVRNDVLTNNFRVVILDSDFSNYNNYEERLSMKITYDQNNFCN